MAEAFEFCDGSVRVTAGESVDLLGFQSEHRVLLSHINDLIIFRVGTHSDFLFPCQDRRIDIRSCGDGKSLPFQVFRCLDLIACDQVHGASHVVRGGDKERSALIDGAYSSCNACVAYVHGAACKRFQSLAGFGDIHLQPERFIDACLVSDDRAYHVVTVKVTHFNRIVLFFF